MFGLVATKLKHEIGREALEIAFDRLVEVGRCDTIESGQISIQHHLLATDQVDRTLNPLQRDDCGLPGHVAILHVAGLHRQGIVRYERGSPRLSRLLIS